jgi:sarcosine oxidase subunit alpha
MSAAFRTDDGGRIDRARLINFTFDGKRYHGFAGDTLASALLANGVHLLGRSFKYHRPRGVLSAGSDEPNALVGLDRGGGRYTPNLRATEIEIYEGLVAVSQNRWPSLAVDVGAINDLMPAGLLSSGFYYKTLMGPGKAWTKLYEPIIRRAAGLGVAPKQADPDHYTHRYAHCEVLIAGAGAAGLAAALAAAETGVRVILCDEQAEMGGGLLSERTATIDGKAASVWASEAVKQLASNPKVTLLKRTQAFGYYAQNFLGLAERVTDHLSTIPLGLPRERLWKVRAHRVILATGALERPLVFPDNDRPGIMLAGATQTFANRYGVKAGHKAVVFTADDSGYTAALDLKAAGVDIVAIADLRAAPGKVAAQALARGVTVMPGSAIVGTSGTKRVIAARIGRISNGTVTEIAPVECDLIAMAGGWTPNVNLFSQSRGKLRFDETRQIFLPDVAAQDQVSVGACNGTFDLGDAMIEAAAAGGATAAIPVTRLFDVMDHTPSSGGYHGAVPHPYKPEKVKAFVDFQNDVTAKDIKLAVQEGFHSIEHVKRYTTTGMATDQGKTSNMNALAIASRALGKSIPDVGLTTFRPPYTPVTFGLFAGHSRGDLFDPIRKTPMHMCAVAQGAEFEDVGQWKRARYFPRGGEDMAAAVARECSVVRRSVGIFDASTLGKIEVVGPDAAEFMNRIYTNAWSKLEVGRCRYGLMLTEAGFILDDGVVGRISADRFHVTTTTGGASRVLAHMEDYLQTEFNDLRVWLTSTTEQWAVIAVQGPKARDVLAPLVSEIDLALPHMSVREGKICNVPTRLFRVSFTGELGYEVNVPSANGRAVWDAIWAAGQQHGMQAYGTEAMHILRAEKGFIIVGQETDGTVTPNDLGLGWTIGKSKPDFVGKRSLAMVDLVKPDRKQLVGLLTDDPKLLLEEGAQITTEANPAIGSPALGHVTSSYVSTTLGRSIALALVAGGQSRIGETLHVPTSTGGIAVKVTKPLFYDPEGARLDA